MGWGAEAAFGSVICVGSSGRTRTYNPSVNSQITHSTATGSLGEFGLLFVLGSDRWAHIERTDRHEFGRRRGANQGR
jgi:hypothetical protein